MALFGKGYAMNIALVIIAGVIGFLVGGIINALADDLPVEEITLRPPHYPDGTARPRAAWLGTLAFLLGKRTSPGGAKLSGRHTITEIVTALLFAYVAVAFPFSVRSVFWMGYLAILVLITVIDLEHRLILFVVVIPSYIFALLGALAAQD